MSANRDAVIELPPLDIENWAAALLTMEEHAIFRCGWEPSQAAYAVDRLKEAGEAMEARGEVLGPVRMQGEALWSMFFAWGEVWFLVNGSGWNTPDLQRAARDKWAEVERLAALRNDMETGMAKLEEIPERAAYAYKRTRDAGIPARRRLPMDHPDYISAGAMFRLTMTYGELWDALSGRTEPC